jgi:uncharacterized membrane protein
MSKRELKLSPAKWLDEIEGKQSFGDKIQYLITQIVGWGNIIAGCIFTVILVFTSVVEFCFGLPQKFYHDPLLSSQKQILMVVGLILYITISMLVGYLQFDLSENKQPRRAFFQLLGFLLIIFSIFLLVNSVIPHTMPEVLYSDAAVNNGFPGL